MTENNEEFDNQDFIEQADDFAEVMDDNFDTIDDPMVDDHIIDVDAIEEPMESFDDEWAEDFNDADDEAMDDGGLAHMAQSSEKNWFNIAFLGAMGLVICVMGYNYILPYFMGGKSQEVYQAQGGVAVQNQNLAVADPQQNALLAQQALSAGGEGEVSILDNPSLLGDGVESIERPDPEATDNAIFEALGNVPEMSEGQVDDIFAAIDSMQSASQEGGITEQVPQQLPIPSDESSQAEEVFEFLPETIAEEPRAPVVETGVAELADAVIPPAVDEVAQPRMDDAELASLNNRMDLMMARIESLTTTVENLSNDEPIFAPVSPVADNGNVERLEKTIQNLEKRIEGLSQKAEKKTSTVSKKKVATKRKTVVVKKVNWELRGASPGQAYVAERGTQNLRTVNIGDSLSGIGRIKSIAMESGRWVVRGTSGRITQ